MKKIILSFLLGVVITLSCFGLLISPWWHAFLLPTRNAHCLPIEYPEYPFGNPAYADNDYEPYIPDVLRTETSLKIIKDFYDENLILDATWNSYEPGHWVRSEVHPGEFLYECGGTLNWEEAERGCIYLRERNGKAIVERIWLYSATNAPSCRAYLSELP